jgi:hypothetical protein
MSNLTNEVIYIDGIPKGKGTKAVKFTHYHGRFKKAENVNSNPKEYDKVIYLGHCAMDGDMFAAQHTTHNVIDIFSGKLNSGKY